MLRLRHPNAATIRAHLERQTPLPFSYPEVGATREAAQGVIDRLRDGTIVDHTRVKLGAGVETFERAVLAVQTLSRPADSLFRKSYSRSTTTSTSSAARTTNLRNSKRLHSSRNRELAGGAT